jgi:LPS export ABC transporter protein LptC
MALGMLFSCGQNEMEEVKALTDREEVPVRTSYGVEMTYNDSGRKRMKLFAERMDQFEDEKGSRVEFRNGFHIIFFDESGDSVDSELEAERGTLYETRSRMIARNDVVVRNPKGERLNTEKLIWDRDSGKVFTDKFVKITRQDGVIHGNGLVAEEDLSRYRIKEITGEWYFEDPAKRKDEKEGQ